MRSTRGSRRQDGGGDFKRTRSPGLDGRTSGGDGRQNLSVASRSGNFQRTGDRLQCRLFTILRFFAFFPTTCCRPLLRSLTPTLKL
ncbi:hypothetical protein C0Q70_10222 [Pomacea canaliculata]|uniref:Uncharacterized protein n=1 Tax=Pomacea canaliculata TaxID=400727 RepID=A0A2T7PC07_POMCA|nr:hypothetical protein C0Q70_10222 [Pomacea canaliculata]